MKQKQIKRVPIIQKKYHVDSAYTAVWMGECVKESKKLPQRKR